jgi:hypothetical protein
LISRAVEHKEMRWEHEAARLGKAAMWKCWPLSMTLRLKHVPHVVSPLGLTWCELSPKGPKLRHFERDPGFHPTRPNFADSTRWKLAFLPLFPTFLALLRFLQGPSWGPKFGQLASVRRKLRPSWAREGSAQLKAKDAQVWPESA